MDVQRIIEKYYKKDSELYNILVRHSKDVMTKALSIIQQHPELEADVQFVQEASMLHDIGIYLTNAPGIHCFGTAHYMCHGYLGREILEKEGFPKHALVCERHTGVGLTVDDIKEMNLPLPLRNMEPETIEEQLICFADCFFSKTRLGQEKSVEKVRAEISRYNNKGALSKFDSWCTRFL